MNSNTAIEISSIKMNYGQLTALKDLSLTIPAGEIFGLIGPDGAGKSTLFNILSGLLQPSAGEIRYFAQSPGSAAVRIGYATQIFSLYQDLSVTENINYIGRLR